MSVSNRMADVKNKMSFVLLLNILSIYILSFNQNRYFDKASALPKNAGFSRQICEYP